MAYATLAAMAARYGETELIELTDRIGSGQIDTAVLDQAIADADAVIDGYLAGRYSLPLSPVPSILIGYGCDLARERLWGDAAADHPVVRRGNDARKFLVLLAEGRVSLGAGDAAVAAGEVLYEFSPRAITDDDLRAYA